MLISFIALAPLLATAALRPIEIHQTLVSEQSVSIRRVALTLDACGGQFDEDLVRFLIANRMPATIFATKKWLDHNNVGLAMLQARPDLFEIEDHGANHIPAVIGPTRKVYGLMGEPDLAHLRREVVDGANAIQHATGKAPHWYRGATAEYDPSAILAIEGWGYQIAGFSVNADAGATLHKAAIVSRLKHVKDGDVIIAHMNKPASDTAEGLAVGLIALLKQGFQFVKLDEARLKTLNTALR